MTNPIRVDSFTIPAQQSLDPINVFIAIHEETPERTSARVTVAVYEEAWTAFFNAMTGSWQQFLSRCDAPYLANALSRGTRGGSKGLAYLDRIATAIREFLRQPHAVALIEAQKIPRDSPLWGERLGSIESFLEVLTELQRSFQHTTNAFASARALAKSWNLLGADSAESAGSEGGGK